MAVPATERVSSPSEGGDKDSPGLSWSLGPGANALSLEQEFESSPPTMGYMDMATHAGEMR